MNQEIQKKIIRVICSCRRKDQLKVAEKYTSLAFRMYPDEDLSEVREVLQKKKDELSWITRN